MTPKPSRHRQCKSLIQASEPVAVLARLAQESHTSTELSDSPRKHVKWGLLRLGLYYNQGSPMPATTNKQTKALRLPPCSISPLWLSYHRPATEKHTYASARPDTWANTSHPNRATEPEDQTCPAPGRNASDAMAPACRLLVT